MGYYGRGVGVYAVLAVVGAEITQEEMEEQRVEAQEYERDRMSGVSSKEIGARRAEREMGSSGVVEESKGEGAVEFIEDKEKRDVWGEAGQRA